MTNYIPRNLTTVLAGKKSFGPTSKIKGIPRSATVFVSRLHIDTCEDDLKDFLTEEGIEDSSCKTLAGKIRTVIRLLRSWYPVIRNIKKFFVTLIPGQKIAYFETGCSEIIQTRTDQMI